MKIKKIFIGIIILLILELVISNIYFRFKNNKITDDARLEEIMLNSKVGQGTTTQPTKDGLPVNATQAEKDAYTIKLNKERVDRLAKEYEDIRLSHGMSSSTPVLPRDEEIKKNEAEIKKILKTFR